MAHAPNGKTILTGDEAGASYLWDVNTGKRIGPSLRTQLANRGSERLRNGPVLAVGFSPEGKTMLMGDIGVEDSKSDPKAWSNRWEVARLDVPVPLEGEVEQILLWIQVVLGKKLDTDGGVVALDELTRRECWRRLVQRGGPPKR